MSGQKRRSNRSRKGPAPRPDPTTFWREDETPGPPPLVRVPDKLVVAATLQSLGSPSVPNGDIAKTEFLKTALQASKSAGALAASIGLLDMGESSD